MAGLYLTLKSFVVLFLITLRFGARESEGAACNIYALVPCIAYAKSAQVPDRACCTALASLGSGVVDRSRCLCSLMTSQVANQYGVVPTYAVGMPHRCRMPVPLHEMCSGMKVPGGW